MGLANAVVLCDISSSETSDHGLRYRNLIVEGPENISFGDQINISFRLRNSENTSKWLGEKGIFITIENAKGNVSYGYSDSYAKIEDSISYEYSMVVDEYGTWRLWPGYDTYDGRESPTYWENCTFEVGRKDHGNADLIATDLWAGIVPDSSSIRVGYVVENIGDWISDSTTTEIYIDNELVRRDDVEVLGPGESRIEYVYYDSECVGDNKPLRIVLDSEQTSTELNESNNQYETTFNCNVEGMPDLELVYAKYIGSERSCRTREYSLQNNIEIKVWNRGLGRSTHTMAVLYIDGVNVSAKQIEPLDANETYIQIYNYTGQCNGESDRIKVVLDETNRIAEEDESNNDMQITFDCFIKPDPTSDLMIENISLNGDDGEFNIGYVVSNIGIDNTCNTRTALFIDNEFVSSDNVDLLDSLMTSEGSFQTNYYLSACTGTEDVIKVVADYDNNAEESNEENNAYSMVIQCIDSLQGKADIQIIDLSYDTKTQSFKSEILNNGSSSTPPTVLKLYLSNNTEHTIQIPELNAGESFVGVFSNLSLTEPYQELTYSIRLVADADNDINEANEDNNLLEQEITIKPQCANKILDGSEENIDCGGECNACIKLSETDSGLNYDDLLLPLVIVGIVVVGALLYLTIAKNNAGPDQPSYKEEPVEKPVKQKKRRYSGYKGKGRHGMIPPEEV